MCGIAGILNNSLHPEKWRVYLEGMSRNLIHRGPDDNGIWFSERDGAGLAQQRLSIIDLSPLGHQPMVSLSGRYVISYNGEVYNFFSLRKECEKAGYKFKGTSDTEVILATIELWGLDNAVKNFIGMFAFALWDRKEQSLYLCRDRIGEKPLYYYSSGNTFCFASELKAICALPFFKKDVNRDVFALLLKYNFIPSPYSIYKDTFKVPPGSYIKIIYKEDCFKLSTTYFWTLRNVAENGQNHIDSRNTVEIINELDNLLSDAVRIRMIADVPLGAFLSGGIDSSTIVALMQKQSSRPVKTFTIGNTKKDFNEANYAKQVSKYLGTDHTELYITPQDFLDIIPQLPQIYDEPLPDSSQIPTYLVSKLTRQHVTVALSGDAGDEIFGGYNRYTRIPKVWRALTFIPSFAKKYIADKFNSSSIIWDMLVGNTATFIRRKGRICNKEEIFSYVSSIINIKSKEDLFKRYLSNQMNSTEVIQGSKEIETLLSASSEWPAFSDFEHVMMYIDILSYLSEDILVKVDRASMATSLETRIPILDHRVVEFAWRLPLLYKINSKQNKWILRQVLYKYVPPALVERPKMGFGIPIGSWLKKELRPWAEELLRSDRLKNEGYFNYKNIEKKWNEHIHGQRDWHYYLWNVLMFQAWYEQNALS